LNWEFCLLSFEPILLAPEEEIEEIYPYRRVWRTSWIEIGILFVAAAVIFALDLFGVLPTFLNGSLFKAGFAALPLGLWLAVSYRAERRAIVTRSNLGGMLLLGALVASGIAIPLEEEVFTPERWLPYTGFFGRVLGHMFTVGFTAEFLKYAAQRYTVWPDQINQRLDGVAYALAISLGFATVLNLRYALLTNADFLATVLRVASYTFSHLAVGVVMGFFLAELVVGRTPVFWLPMGLGIASLLSGLYYAFHIVAIVGGLSQIGTGARPIRGLAFGFGFVAVIFIIFAFLIDNADRRMTMGQSSLEFE
jgi:RsiW-degrading membrane proteinase PrsW (M82 family)